MLVVVAGVFVALWIDTTAAKVDQGTLDRGADAVTANLEEQIRILELAGTGTQTLLGQSLQEADLASITSKLDTSVLTALVGVVVYPVTDEGARHGSRIELGLSPFDFEVPTLAVSPAQIAELLDSGDAFLSPPVATNDPERSDYVVAIPVRADAELELIGVIFRLDRMLETSLASAGEGQYAARVEDLRIDQEVVSMGDPVGDLEVERSPDGVKRQLALFVAPGPEFPFSQSGWVPAVVVAVGLVVASLLVWMGRMAQARADDLAERLRLAHELNESKDRFLATVSHELRTPLTVVVGAAAEAGTSWDSLDPHDRNELLAMMSEQANEASNIVEDLLVAARSDPTKLRLAIEDTGLDAHVAYAISSLPSEARTRISWRGSDVMVRADSTRLRQILRNLLENAVKYGGREVRVEIVSDAQFVRVEVRDNGEGVVVSDLERIFEPYEQSGHATPESPTGVGIGLYVSRLLARLMGGELDCVRSVGETVFRLVLPVGEAEASMDAAEPATSVA